jgi:hypothetical protein
MEGETTHPEEPMQVVHSRSVRLSRNLDVHSPKTGDQVHLCNGGGKRSVEYGDEEGTKETNRNENGTERSELREDVVDLIVSVGPAVVVKSVMEKRTEEGRDAHLNRNLSEIVRVRPRQNLFVVRQILSTRCDMILNIGEVESLFVRSKRLVRGEGRRREDTHNIGFWSDRPVLVAALRKSLDDIGLVTHETEETHDLLATCSDPVVHERISIAERKGKVEKRNAPPQHITLLGLLQDQHQFIDRVDLVLDILDERSESVGDVVDEGVRDPIRGDVDVVLELLDAATDVLRMRGATEVELRV